MGSELESGIADMTLNKPTSHLLYLVDKGSAVKSSSPSDVDKILRGLEVIGGDDQRLKQVIREYVQL